MLRARRPPSAATTAPTSARRSAPCRPGRRWPSAGSRPPPAGRPARGGRRMTIRDLGRARPGARTAPRAPYDPLRLCIFATVALLGWLLGPLALLVLRRAGAGRLRQGPPRRADAVEVPAAATPGWCWPGWACSWSRSAVAIWVAGDRGCCDRLLHGSLRRRPRRRHWNGHEPHTAPPASRRSPAPLPLVFDEPRGAQEAAATPRRPGSAEGAASSWSRPGCPGYRARAAGRALLRAAGRRPRADDRPARPAARELVDQLLPQPAGPDAHPARPTRARR